MIRKQVSHDIMAQVIEPTNDAGYMVANRIEPVLASAGPPKVRELLRHPVSHRNNNPILRTTSAYE
ncbi:hypothetical protein D9X36_16110 [Escherichia coli]|nr:hypothetical protein [Escherichia coli]